MSPTTTPMKADRVEKFDGKNFNLWLFKMKMHFIGKGLWGYIDPIGVKNDSTNVEEAAKAHALLIMHLSDNAVMHIIEARNGREAWTKLIDFYNS